MDSQSGKMSALMLAATPQGMRLAKSVAWADEWAMMIGMQVDGHPFTYEGRPFLREIIRDNFPQRAIQKSAQMGATVISLTTALHWWAMRHWNVMYLLPLKAGTIAFSQGRIEPMLNSTPWLKSRLRAVDNINHKRTDRANFYVRGTNVTTELQEVPIDAMIWDERDKMKEKNMSMADTRMDASKWKWKVQLSTPTLPNVGINRAFQESDQRHWYMKCPKCGTAQTLNWEDHVKIGKNHKDTIIECEHCHKEWPHDKIIEASEESGHWVKHEEGQSDEIHGYQINQLFSPTRPIEELARIYFKGLDDPETMRELYNSALGLPYIVEGDRLTEDVLDDCAKMGSGNLIGIGKDLPLDERLYIGIDVGKVLHVTIDRMKPDGIHVEAIARETMSWAELHLLLDRIPDFMCVIDRFPEIQKTQELALRFWGRVFLCTYNTQARDPDWTYPTDRSDVGQVKVDRTIALDYTNNRFFRRHMILARNMRDIGERQQNRGYQGWYRQMMSQVRLQEQNKAGNMIATYEKADGPDHWHHSQSYCTLATLFATPGVAPLAEQTGQVLTGEEIGLYEEDEFADLLVGEDIDDDYGFMVD